MKLTVFKKNLNNFLLFRILKFYFKKPKIQKITNFPLKLMIKFKVKFIYSINLNHVKTEFESV